jgi:hypothetical protein
MGLKSTSPKPVAFAVLIVADAPALGGGDVVDRIGERERGDFQPGVTEPGHVGQRVLDFPALINLVANGELHARQDLKLPGRFKMKCLNPIQDTRSMHGGSRMAGRTELENSRRMRWHTTDA